MSMTTKDYLDFRMNGRLEPWLLASREKGLSFRAISGILSDLGHDVSTTTVFRWISEMGKNGKI